MSTPRTGVLGGTFDPIHLGHYDLARAARDAVGLDRVLLVPSRVPPHRIPGPAASAADRLEMVKLVASRQDGFEACSLEIQSTGPSYTAVTLERLGEGHPWQLFFITGADAFAEIATWHRYPEVLDLSHFVVVSRPRCPVEALPRLLPELASRMRPIGHDVEHVHRTHIWLVDAKTRDISSSDIRARLGDGRSVDGLVDQLVARYIARHGLYRFPRQDATLHD